MAKLQEMSEEVRGKEEQIQSTQAHADEHFGMQITLIKQQMRWDAVMFYLIYCYNSCYPVRTKSKIDHGCLFVCLCGICYHSSI